MIVDEDTEEHTFTTITTEKDAGVTTRYAAVTKWEVADAQHEFTHRALLDVTSTKESAVMERGSLGTRPTSAARALATVISGWKEAKKD